MGFFIRADAQSLDGLEVVVLIDSSGSMGETDPDDLRTKATYYLLDFLDTVSGVQNFNVQYARANFDTEIISTQPLVSLRDGVEKGAIPTILRGDTDFRPALEFAIQQRANQNKPMVVFLFTDGDPKPVEDLDVYFQEGANSIKSQVKTLKEIGGELFVIAMGDSVNTRQQWVQIIGSDHYRAITESTDLPGVYHDLLAELLSLNTVDSATLENGSKRTVELQPYLEQVIFSVIKESPKVEVSLSDPFDAQISPERSDRDIHEVYLANEPQPGAWNIQVEGGNAQLWVDRVLPSLFLMVPSEPIGVGRSLEVEGSLLRGETIIKDDNVHLSLDVTTPNGEQNIYEMNSSPTGRYKVQLPPLSTTGKYTLKLSAFLDNAQITAEVAPLAVDVYPVPEIISIKTRGELQTSEVVFVEVRLANGDRIGEETRVGLNVLDAQGVSMGMVTLKNDGNSPDKTADDDVFSGAVTFSSVAGSYFLEAFLEGTTTDGVQLNIEAMRTQVDVVAPVLSTPSPTETQGVKPSPTAINNNEGVQLPIPFSWVVSLLSILGGGFVYTIYTLQKNLRLERRDRRKEKEEWKQQYEKERERTEKERERTDWERKVKNLIEEGSEAFEKGGNGRKFFFDALDILADHLDNKVSKTVGNLFDAWTEKEKKFQMEEIHKIISGQPDIVVKGFISKLIDNHWKGNGRQFLDIIYGLQKTDSKFSQEEVRSVLRYANEHNVEPFSSLAEAILKAINNPFDKINFVKVREKILQINDSDEVAIIYQIAVDFIDLYPDPKWNESAYDEKIETFVDSDFFSLLNKVKRIVKGLPTKENLSHDDYAHRCFEYYDKDEIDFDTYILEASLFKNYFMACKNSFSTSLDVRMQVWPSLDLSFKEEDFDYDHVDIKLPVLISNYGEKDAYDVEIKADLQMSNSPKIDNLSTDSSRQYDNLSIDSLRHCSFKFGKLKFKNLTESNIKVSGSYRQNENANEIAGVVKHANGIGDSRTISINSPKKIPESIKEQLDEEKHPLQPLVSDDLWKEIAVGDVDSIVNGIVEMLDSVVSFGRLGRVTGLRRSGKTTVLKRVQNEIAVKEHDSLSYLVVYIDLLSFSENIKWEFDKNSNDQGRTPLNYLWGAIAHQLYEDLRDKEMYEDINPEEVIKAAKNADETFPSFSNDSFPVLQRNQFVQFINSTKNKTGRKNLLLLWDEGDAFLGEPWNDKIIDKMKMDLRDFVHNEVYVVLIAHSYGEYDWDKEFDDLGPNSELRLTPYVLNLLSKSQTKKLMKKGGLKYTELGEETMWAFTGGYIPCIHILSDYMIKKIKRGDITRWPLTSAVVKKAVMGVVQSPPWWNQLDYLRYGWSALEELILIVLSENTSLPSGIIQGISLKKSNADIIVEQDIKVKVKELADKFDVDLKQNELEGGIDRMTKLLKHKQLIEPVNEKMDKFHWRVGLQYIFVSQILDD